MTSEVLPDQADLSDLWRSNLSPCGKTLTLDFMIGNKNFLGKGLGAATLKAFTAFIHRDVDPNVDTFFIDPAISNTRAVHVYENGGFRSIAPFKRRGEEFLLMCKTIYSVEEVTSQNEQEMVEFLKGYEETSLFLLGNYELYGYKRGDAPYSGNFYIIRRLDGVAAVFCQTKSGTILFQTEVDSIFNLLVLYPSNLKSWIWATRKLPRSNDRKSLNIVNIKRLTIVRSRGFGAAEIPTFEITWVYIAKSRYVE